MSLGSSLAPAQVFLHIRVIALVLVLVTCASVAVADASSASAHIKLTDGIIASSSATDGAWVSMSKDSTQLPAALDSPTSIGFFGTGEYKSSTSNEIAVEALMKAAGSRAYRTTIYLNVFPEPDGSSPNWDWGWYNNYPDGQRISRAIANGQMVNITVNKFPQWSNKSLALEHPPMKIVSQERVTLNGTTPVSLSHKFIFGEKNEPYDKVGVVLASSSLQSVSNEWVGAGSGGSWQELSLKNKNIVPGSLKLYVNGVQWNEVVYFRASSTLDKQAYVFFPNTGKIRFGDGWLGAKLPSGSNVTATYSYYTTSYREYSSSTYNNSEQLDYRIDYANGTIKRTSNSTIPNGVTVMVTYYYLDTSWWQQFWKELTANYAGKVKYFEPWNEENLDKFWYGSMPQYIEMMRTASLGAKSGNSDAVVVLGGLGWSTDYLSKLYSAGAKSLFQVAAWHPYGWETGLDTPGSHANLLNNYYFSSMSANNDSSKPVFLNEVGFSTSTQVGISWGAQAIELSRMYMKLRRNPQVENLSWWGVVDEEPLGQQENELYVSHMGLMAKDSSGNLQLKPSYYAFKNFGTNKGLIIDLASYGSSGNVTQWTYTFNKAVVSSFANDLAEVKVFASSNNVNDWYLVSGTSLLVSQNSNGTFTYTLSFPQVSARFVQLQFVKKSGVSNFKLDEVKILSTSGTNIALNKLYAIEGFSISQSAPPTPVQQNPTPNFTYVLDSSSKSIAMTNTTTPGTATLTGYLWFVNGVQLSNAINFTYLALANQDLNICLEAYYTGGAGGYVQKACKLINTGASGAENPTSSFSYTIDKENQRVVLDNQSTPGAATITGYLWFNNGTQISNAIDYNYQTSQQQDLNICLRTYYVGGISGYVVVSCKSFNTGVWGGSASNPVANFNYSINSQNGLLTLTNTTTPGTAAITGYLWYDDAKYLSSNVNYSYTVAQNTDLNICLYVFYTGGIDGYRQKFCRAFNTGSW